MQIVHELLLLKSGLMSVNSSKGSWDFKNDKAVLKFHVLQYLGLGGLTANTSFAHNRETS